MLGGLIFVLVITVFAPNPENAVIRSGTVWLDTKGNEIHAHGGGILYDENSQKYYWVGTTKKLPPDWLSEGINVYSSYDLGNWTFENRIFDNTSIVSNTPGPYRIERPKVIFNKSTKMYVMWFHLDTASFSMQSVGVAVSESITGKYKWVSGFKPDGLASYDMTIYQDADGTAYLCRSVQNSYAGISQLTDDYLNTKGIISKGPKIEGQAIWKMNDKYYLLGSHLTGWTPNQAVLSISDRNTLNGAVWTVLPVITSSSTTYDSQSTFVLPYIHPNGKMLPIFMGDRWASPNIGAASYVWLPLVVKSEKEIQLPWEESWTIGDF